MKNVTIDVKSLVVGVAIGLGIMFGLGASTSVSSGRYQITSSGIYLAVLDSETGQVWAGKFRSSNGKRRSGIQELPSEQR